MNAAEMIATLTEATLASSVAIALVLVLRRPLRIHFGATVAYAGWLLVPAALLAVLLPAAIEPAAVVTLSARAGIALHASATGAVASVDWMLLATWTWVVGVLVAAIGFGVQQRRFHRTLGVLRARADGLQQAASIHGLPAALGLLRPRIVVPADFDRRYSVEQQALMRAHERSHIRAGDLHVNAVVAALRCLLWFNPLLHLASRHFRHDQELACDQRVIARYPHSRRAYGEAMFKTQLAAQPLALGCHWGYGHPLKERIEMLKQPVPPLSRWIGGSLAVAALTLAVGYSAWAAQPPQVAAEQMATAKERTPPPRYPAEAAKQGINGKVILLVDIDANGGVTDIEVERSEPAGVFDQASIDAARQWTFQPRIEDGKPVPSRVRVPVTFESEIVVGDSAEGRLPPPAYPAAAVAQKISGMVLLVIDIDAHGTPVEIVVERAEPAGVFDQAAVDAAWKWKFTPEVENGKPVASRVRVPVEFEIPPGEGGAGGTAGVDMTALLRTGSVAQASCGKTAGHIGSETMVCLGN